MYWFMLQSAEGIRTPSVLQLRCTPAIEMIQLPRETKYERICHPLPKISPTLEAEDFGETEFFATAVENFLD
jgi:hypothetical protein